MVFLRLYNFNRRSLIIISMPETETTNFQKYCQTIVFELNSTTMDDAAQASSLPNMASSDSLYEKRCKVNYKHFY